MVFASWMRRILFFFFFLNVVLCGNEILSGASSPKSLLLLNFHVGITIVFEWLHWLFLFSAFGIQFLSVFGSIHTCNRYSISSSMNSFLKNVGTVTMGIRLAFLWASAYSTLQYYFCPSSPNEIHRNVVARKVTRQYFCFFFLAS